MRRIVLPLAVVLAVISVAADGPVSQIAGVVETNDTDNGNGEQWGRVGGRTLTFSVGNTSAYATLHWGATQAPSAAFDDNVNSAGEIMTFDPSSALAQGVARWTGSAPLPLLDQPAITVPTRFTLTVTNGAVPVPLSNVNGGPSPGINVKPLTTFTANLLFEAFHNGTWQPLLTFFDGLTNTIPGNPPGQGGPVLTSFSRGFYFTDAPTGMTIEEHDTNITQRLTALAGQATSIKDDTAFTRIEALGRIAGVQSSVNEVKTSVNNVSTSVNAVKMLVENIPPLPNDLARRSDVTNAKDQLQQSLSGLATQGSVDQVRQSVTALSMQLPNDLARRADVDSAKNSINDLLMILIGLKPCPLSPADCANLTFMPQVARQTTAEQIKQKVDLLATQAGMDQLQQALNALATNASVDDVKLALNALATAASVEQVKQELIDLAAAVDAINAAIAAPAQSLELQVVELTDKDSPKRRRWLLRTSLGGTPAAAQLTGLVAISANKKQPSTATQVLSLAATAQLMPGLLEVVLDVPESDVKDMSFEFSVRHAGTGGNLDAGILIGSSK
jgi:hypothetical protein